MRCGSALILWLSWERVQVPRGAAKVIRHHYNPSNLRSGSLSLGRCAATACHETFDIPRAACDSSLAPVYLRGIALASFANVLQADALAKTKSAAVERLTACGRDWIVLDAAFSSDTLWERADLDTIRSGHGERKVVDYISIGEAEITGLTGARSGRTMADLPPLRPPGSARRTRSGRATTA
jgi:hypothetical protein